MKEESTIPVTPLEKWIQRKIGLNAGTPLTPENLAQYQLGKFRDTIAYVREHSPFYRQRLKKLPGGFPRRMTDIPRIPFTTADVLRQNPDGFLCVSRSRVARAVTLRTSGTTASPKRLFFTESDLELTVDFFHHGMSALVSPGQNVLILMPGDLPGSIGDLLIKGLARMDAAGIVKGPVSDPEKTLRDIRELDIDTLVGLPVQVLGLARHPAADILPAGRIKSVLLSADYVPDAVTAAIRQKWKCPVFTHYGMTETGLGGGVECAALSGYHLREADLLFEIVDPAAGEPVADNTVGEVVFSTLTRQAMPLIRYRTGDLAAWITEPCPCGSILRRMGKVRGRRNEMVKIEDGVKLSLPALDEMIFSVSGVTDYRVEIRNDSGQSKIQIIVQTASSAVWTDVRQAVTLRLKSISELAGIIETGRLNVVSGKKVPPPKSTAIKRRIVDLRKDSENDNGFI